MILSNKVIESISEAIESGLVIADQCAVAMISTRSYYSWQLEADELVLQSEKGIKREPFKSKAKEKKYKKRKELILHFLHTIKKETAEFKRARLKIIKTKGEETWQASAWLLERRFPEEFGASRLQLKEKYEDESEVETVDFDFEEITEDNHKKHAR